MSKFSTTSMNAFAFIVMIFWSVELRELGNLSVSYALSDGFRGGGIKGYQLKQISDDKIDGHNQHDSREKVTGIGPGLMYQKGPNVFFANYFIESGAQNRAEGNLLNFRYIYLF